jgi:hypothetical protein
MEKTKRFCARKIFDLPFSFEIDAIEGKVKNVKQHATGVDISSCGLGMKTRYALREGSVLKFFLPMRELEVTIPVFAQVMWSKPSNDHFRVGLRFLA